MRFVAGDVVRVVRLEMDDPPSLLHAQLELKTGHVGYGMYRDTNDKLWYADQLELLRSASVPDGGLEPIEQRVLEAIWRLSPLFRAYDVTYVLNFDDYPELALRDKQDRTVFNGVWDPTSACSAQELVETLREALLRHCDPLQADEVRSEEQMSVQEATRAERLRTIRRLRALQGEYEARKPQTRETEAAAGALIKARQVIEANE